MTSPQTVLPQIFQQFDSLPDTAVLPVSSVAAITHKSKQSIFRQLRSGELTRIKVGGSTRIQVGELRKLLALRRA